MKGTRGCLASDATVGDFKVRAMSRDLVSGQPLHVVHPERHSLHLAVKYTTLWPAAKPVPNIAGHNEIKL